MTASHADRRCCRYTASASTAERRGTSSGAFHGRIGCVGSRPTEHSQDFADATTRAGTSAPRARASSPSTCSAGPQGRSRLSGGNSFGAGRYTNDGSCARAWTTPGFTSCGTVSASTRAASSPGATARVSTQARTQLVVPRSMPTT
jgi:hypothetical protein